MADTVDSGSYTPETIKRRQALAAQLLNGSMGQEPIRHWAQGLAQMGRAALGGYMGYQANQDEKSARSDAMAQVAAALSGQGGAPTAAPGAAPSPGATTQAPSPIQYATDDKFNSIDAMADLKPETQANLPAARGAVSGIESGGRYDAMGPLITSGPMAGQRANGKYQVMDSNVAPWTKEVMGRSMTPQEFVSNPDAQDAVFNGKFGGYMDKYGAGGAARAWHAGERGMNNPGAQDQLGTRTADYGQRVASALNADDAGIPPKEQPVQATPLNTQSTPSQGGAPQVAAALNAPPQGAPAGAAPAAGAAGLGANPNNAKIAALLTNPWIDGSVKAAVLSQLAPSYGFQTLPDGTILRTNPKSGTVEPIYSAPVKPELKESGSDPITGQKSFQIFDSKTGTMRPVAGAGGAPSQPQSGFLAPGVSAVDHSLSGDDYLKQYGPEVQAAVKSYINGDVMPSGNPRMQSLANTAKTIAQKYGADMGIPVSDATYSQRRTYRSQLGSNSPSSSGGQAKAFNQGIEHMGHLADTLEKLDNSNGLGIPIVASAVNSIRQGVSTDQSAISDKASSIGQTLAGEVGKLFSGSAGGGVHERELTRERFSTVKSKPQLAAALEGTLEMMRGGLTALEQRRDEVMGPNNGIRFVNPETEAKMAKIQETIDRLKGGKTAPAAPEGGDPVEAEMRKRGLLK